MERIIESCRLAVNLFAGDNFISDSYRGYCYLTLNAVPLLQSGLIVAGISIVVLALFIFGARKTQLASFNFSFF